MNKLQLYINFSLRGFKNVRNINPTENIRRHIREVRPALDQLNYDATQKYVFFLINYIDEGTFFTILRTIPEGASDHMATTIFIPNGMRISKEETASIIKQIIPKVSKSSVTAEDLTELHELFSKEYEIDEEVPRQVASQGREYAMYRYGEGADISLQDFLGEHLYQPDFLPYAGVLLVDNEFGLEYDGEDITGMPIAEPATLLPPEEASDGFKPYVYGYLLDKPLRVPFGGTLTVVWKRNGFEDIEQEINILAEEVTLDRVSTAESRKTITPSTFYITSQATKAPVDEAEIVVNGKAITGPTVFTYAELENAQVDITAPGCNPYHSKINLVTTTQALIQLPEHRKIYRFEMPVKTSELGSPIRFEIHTKRDMKDSPIEGYALLDDIKEGASRVNHLDYTGKSSWLSKRTTILLIIGMLAVGFALGWIIAPRGEGKAEPEAVAQEVKTRQPEQPQKPAPKVDQPAAKPVEPVEPTTPAEPEATPEPMQNTAAAIAYLENNKVWKKEDMEKFADLRGLFDDMNTYNLERIRTYWKPLLAVSKNFALVAKAAEEQNWKKKFVPKEGDTYCHGTDTEITWKHYTYKIDP